MSGNRSLDKQQLHYLLKADLTESTNDDLLTSDTADWGAWVEILAETAFDTNYVNIYLHHNSTLNQYDVQIGRGALGEEVVSIDGMISHTNITGLNIETVVHPFKVEVPKGTRLSARTKATNNTDTIKIKCLLSGT